MLPEKYEEKDSLVVPSYFIDTNHHMNNTRYVQVAMEYVPKEFRTMEVRVEYKKACDVQRCNCAACDDRRSPCDGCTVCTGWAAICSCCFFESVGKR